MPLFIRIEAVGLEEVDALPIQTQAVMAAMTANTMPPLPDLDVLPIPAPPLYITDVLTLQV